jgi:hypothetical protein
MAKKALVKWHKVIEVYSPTDEKLTIFIFSDGLKIMDSKGIEFDISDKDTTFIIDLIKEF